MSEASIHYTLIKLLTELLDGQPGREGYILNGGDVGLLRSLDKLSAAAASARAPGGGASIAAHVDHVAYGFGLFNRWSRGEKDPFSSADWSASWTRPTVGDAEWQALRQHLREEARAWKEALAQPRAVSPIELNGMVASIVHLAYHFGAIRQIDRSIRGPLATE